MFMAKKKHKLKPIPKLPPIEGDFQVACFDLSFARPGMALLQYHADTRTVELLRKDIVQNKTQTKKKPHGQIIHEIGKLFTEYIAPQAVKVVVRERGFVMFNAESAALYKTQGALDMILWDRKETFFQEYPPLTIKKAVTGWGKATKEEVAQAIDNYIPEHANWRSDDESDAVAVGLCWLINNGYIETIPLEQYRERFEKDKEKEAGA